jgi:hypothetical protein
MRRRRISKVRLLKNTFGWVGCILIFFLGISAGLAILFLPEIPIILYTNLKWYYHVLACIAWWSFMSGSYAWSEFEKGEKHW